MDRASKQDNQGWPFSDEAAARNAGDISPDPTSDHASGVDPTDPKLCAAIVDRLTFNSTIIETGTDSYRLAHTSAHHTP